MKKILIISATSRSNLELGKAIAAQAPDGVETSFVVLEDLKMPLYNPKIESEGVPSDIVDLTVKMAEVGAFILIAPEYNGSIPPVVNNAIAWISRASKEWRASF